MGCYQSEFSFIIAESGIIIRNNNETLWCGNSLKIVTQYGETQSIKNKTCKELY